MRSPDTVAQPLARGATFESATWHAALTLVREINRALRPSAPPSPSALAQIAAELSAMVPDREGPMPLEIEAFIQAHGAPAG